MIFWVIYLIGVVVLFLSLNNEREEVVNNLMKKHNDRYNIEQVYDMARVLLSFSSWLGLLIYYICKKK